MFVHMFVFCYVDCSWAQDCDERRLINCKIAHELGQERRSAEHPEKGVHHDVDAPTKKARESHGGVQSVRAGGVRTAKT